MVRLNCVRRSSKADGMFVCIAGISIAVIFARSVERKRERKNQNVLLISGRLLLFAKVLFLDFWFFFVLLFGQQFLVNKIKAGEKSSAFFFYRDSLILRYSFSMNLTWEEKSLSLSVASFSIESIRLSSILMVFCVVFCMTLSCIVIPPFY